MLPPKKTPFKFFFSAVDPPQGWIIHSLQHKLAISLASLSACQQSSVISEVRRCLGCLLTNTGAHCTPSNTHHVLNRWAAAHLTGRMLCQHDKGEELQHTHTVKSWPMQFGCAGYSSLLDTATLPFCFIARSSQTAAQMASATQLHVAQAASLQCQPPLEASPPEWPMVMLLRAGEGMGWI